MTAAYFPGGVSMLSTVAQFHRAGNAKKKVFSILDRYGMIRKETFPAIIPPTSGVIIDKKTARRQRMAAQTKEVLFCMSEECTHDCSTCSANCASREGGEPESLLAPLNPRSSVKKAVAVMSGKGGVGKSLVTSLLACEAARRGYRTGILDGDVTGPSIPASFGLHQKADSDGEVLYPVRSKTGIDVMSVNLLLENETDPVIWRGPIIGGVIRQFWTDVLWDDVDFLFVDMPPGTGDAQLTLLQSLPIAGIVIVTSPQELVGMIVSKAVGMAKMMNVPLLGVVENMSWAECPKCGEKLYLFGESNLEETALRYDTPILARLPLDPAVAAAVDRGEVESLPGDRVKTAMDVIARLLK